MRFFLPCLTAVILSGIGTSHAQSNVVDIKGMEIEVQQTPDFDAGGVSSKKVPNPRSWLEVEVEFEVAKTPQGIYPEIKFRYHVAIKGAQGGTSYLTGDVDHVNVVPDRELYSVIYASPTTLGTITGDFENFQAGDVAAVAVEVFVNGVVAGGKSEGASGRWWDSGNLSRSDGTLLAKPDTPFALLWMDRYADIKASR